VIYFDTSYLVRLYYRDAGADAVRVPAATDHVACAAHGQAEMIAAFHRKLREEPYDHPRMRPYSAKSRPILRLERFAGFAQDGEVCSRIRQVYQKLPASVFLRSADAIHLATAAESAFRIVYSNDTHLLAAAQHFGI
jgi:predicted nucleic acid-binding protein